jgi:hypothetical protein
MHPDTINQKWSAFTGRYTRAEAVEAGVARLAAFVGADVKTLTNRIESARKAVYRKNAERADTQWRSA